MAIKSIQSSVGRATTRKSKIFLFEFGLGPQPVFVTVNDETVRAPLPFNCTFKRWTFNCASVPIGADAVVDIFLDGVSIFDTANSNKAVFPAGGSGLYAGTSFKTLTGMRDQLMHGVVLMSGGSTIAKGIVVSLEFEP